MATASTKFLCLCYQFVWSFLTLRWPCRTVLHYAQAHCRNRIHHRSDLCYSHNSNHSYYPAMCNNYVLQFLFLSNTLLGLTWFKTLITFMNYTSIVYERFSDKLLLSYKQESVIILAGVWCQVSSDSQLERRPCAYWVPDLRGQQSIQLQQSRELQLCFPQKTVCHTKLLNPHASKTEFSPSKNAS